VSETLHHQEKSQFALLRERRFAPFFATQFCGALNDNVFKQALVALITFHAASLTSLDAGVLVNLANGLYILPFFLFSATAGQLADKYEKTRIIRVVKLAEIAIMVLAAIGFMTSNLQALLAALFLMGVHSTFFGPVKYSILPQHLHRNDLVGANALVESGTFLAILLGSIGGGLLFSSMGSGAAMIGTVTILLAVLGYLACRYIPTAPPPVPALRVNWNLFSETWRNLQFTRGNRPVFLSILGISWFWFYGAMFLAQMPSFAKTYLGGDETVLVVLLTTFSIGIGLGSLLCERLSGHTVEIGLVPFGSIGLTAFALDLYFASPATGASTTIGAMTFLSSVANWRMLVDLLLIGMFGGLYIVPLYALVQTRSDPAHQSRIIAGNNIMNAAFMVVAAVLGAALLHFGASIPTLFLVTAILNAVVAIYIYSLVPEFLMRFLAWLVVHAVYRIKKTGLENVPETGPAVVVCNHVSFADAVIIMGLVRRPVRFVMDHNIFKVPLLSFIFRTSNAIPIAPAKEDPAALERAYDEIARALAAGEIVGIFPEGRLTDTGELLPFRGGIKRIIERTPVPVVPMALRGLWGSFFSRKDGPAMTKPFRRGVWSRIGLVVAPPWPPDQATPEALQACVLSLRGEER
jgi:1-acyl-sn-glycerol-3-phosphate acyltransferase